MKALHFTKLNSIQKADSWNVMYRNHLLGAFPSIFCALLDIKSMQFCTFPTWYSFPVVLFFQIIDRESLTTEAEEKKKTKITEKAEREEGEIACQRNFPIWNFVWLRVQAIKLADYNIWFNGEVLKMSLIRNSSSTERKENGKLVRPWDYTI